MADSRTQIENMQNIKMSLVHLVVPENKEVWGRKTPKHNESQSHKKPTEGAPNVQRWNNLINNKKSIGL